MKNWFLIESDCWMGKIALLIFCLNQGRLVVQIRAEGGCMRVRGTVLNTLKGGATEKRRWETKILKRGGKLGQGVGALKKGVLEPPF